MQACVTLVHLPAQAAGENLFYGHSSCLFCSHQRTAALSDVCCHTLHAFVATPLNFEAFNQKQHGLEDACIRLASLLQNDSLATLLARLEGILGPLPQHMVRKGRFSHRFYTRQGVIYERSQRTVRRFCARTS